MYTNTFTRERHVEELRAELRGSFDPDEAAAIRAELAALLSNPDSLDSGETASD